MSENTKPQPPTTNTVLIEAHNALCQQLGDVYVKKEQLLSHCNNQLTILDKQIKDLLTEINKIADAVPYCLAVEGKVKSEREETTKTRG